MIALPLHVDASPDGLGAKQELFAFLLGQLLGRIYAQGYSVRMGETWRSNSAQQAALREGRSKVSRSLHQDKLAADLNLFRGGEYLDKTEDHRAFGEWWETLHPLCRWGGRFADGNHYSVTHGGRK